MNVTLILFYILAITAIGSALLVVSMRNLVRSLFLFFVTLFAMAGLYVFALADFVALTQIVVYVGGVLVLMLFAFMLSNKLLLNDLKDGFLGIFAIPKWQGVIVALTFGAVLLYSFSILKIDHIAWIEDASANKTMISPDDNTLHFLGVHLMTRFLLPFEVISVFLMMALIGAAHISRKVDNV